MWFEFVIMVGLGILFVFIGWGLWKKEKITWIHDYHYTKVTEENKKPYTEKMGKAMIIIGCGAFLTGIIDMITGTGYGLVALGIGIVWGLGKMYLAQKKYNHGVF